MFFYFGSTRPPKTLSGRKKWRKMKENCDLRNYPLSRIADKWPISAKFVLLRESFPAVFLERILRKCVFLRAFFCFFRRALYKNDPFSRSRFASAISKKFFLGRILFKGPFKSPRIIIELPIKLAPQTHTWEQKLTTGTSD